MASAYWYNDDVAYRRVSRLVGVLKRHLVTDWREARTDRGPRRGYDGYELNLENVIIRIFNAPVNNDYDSYSRLILEISDDRYQAEGGSRGYVLLKNLLDHIHNSDHFVQKRRELREKVEAWDRDWERARAREEDERWSQLLRDLEP